MFYNSKKHLRKVQQGYFVHLYFALKWGVFLTKSGVFSVIHGICPALFPFRAPENVLRVADMIVRTNRFDGISSDLKEKFQKNGPTPRV
jgi:hypothetical protein